MPEHEFTYDPSQPGSGLDHRGAQILARPHAPREGETTVEMVEEMMARKRTKLAALLAAEAEAAAAAEAEAEADTRELEDLLREIRARREQADRLLFTGNRRPS